MKVQKASLADLKKLHEEGKLFGVFETSIEDYHNAPGISSSSIGDFRDSAATFKHYRENPKESTQATDTGRILHTLVLEHDKFPELYAVAPESIERRGTNAWKEFVLNNPGKHHIKFNEFEDAKTMAQTARNHPRAALLEGLKELSFFWKDPTTGLVCKCRPDNITKKGVLVDYKTAECVFPKDVWSRQMANWNYHVQGAFYLDGVLMALEQSGTVLEGIEALKAFVFFSQEKKAPFLVKPWILGEISIQLGRRTYQKALKGIKECEEKGEWPGYPEELKEVECPDYLWDQEGEKESA